VEKSVSADAKVDKSGLDAGLEVDDAPFVDVADDVLGGKTLDIEFFEHAVFHDGDSRLLVQERIDEHVLFHS
jgi:hypothetical protein